MCVFIKAKATVVKMLVLIEQAEGGWKKREDFVTFLKEADMSEEPETSVDVNLLPLQFFPVHALEFFCTHPETHLQGTNHIFRLLFSCNETWS